MPSCDCAQDDTVPLDTVFSAHLSNIECAVQSHGENPGKNGGKILGQAESWSSFGRLGPPKADREVFSDHGSEDQKITGQVLAGSGRQCWQKGVFHDHGSEYQEVDGQTLAGSGRQSWQKRSSTTKGRKIRVTGQSLAGSGRQKLAKGGLPRPKVGRQADIWASRGRLGPPKLCQKYA